MNGAERKFVSLRKRLDQLGYKQLLGIESLPLVERLFSDLVHTTESLRNAKLSAGKPEADGENHDFLLEPYKAENARLVMENNELHLELLRAKEEKDRATRELSNQIRKLHHDTSDLKFLNNQYVHKLRGMEKDGKTKSERIQQLQEKNLQAVVQTPGGKKHSFPFRRQKMQIDELVPPPVTSGYPVSQPDDPYVADLLQLADERIHELQEDIIKAKLELENAQECIKHLNSQVRLRDKEIDRLNHALQGGRPQDVISLEAQNATHEKMIANLNLQLECLQETNRTLEEKVQGLQHKKKNVSTEVADLSLKNLELCKELTHIDHLAKQMEIDKDRVLETADMELQDAKREIERLQKIIEDLEDVITTVRREQSEGSFERDRLRDQLMDLKEQNGKIEGLVNYLEDEKSRLQDKVEQMLADDKDLVLELESMREKYGVCRRERSPSRLDAFVKSLEEERDFFRQEAERYKRGGGFGDQDLSFGRNPHRGRSPRTKGGLLEGEFIHVVRERDELKDALLDIERRMKDIQDNAKILSAERDKFITLFKQAQEDLRLARNHDASPDVLQLKEDVRRAEVRLQQMDVERDGLVDKLRAAQTSALSDRQVEQRRILELENAVKTLERERQDLRSQVRLLKECGDVAKEELNARSAAHIQTAEEVAQKRAESSALRLLHEQMEKSLSDAQRRLSVKMNELQVAHEQIESLEVRMGELSQHGTRHKDETSSLQNTIATLDREKDALQDEVDHKTEKVVALQEENNRKDQTIAEQRIKITNMENSLAQQRGALNSREREIVSLRRQLDAGHNDLSVFQRDKDVAINENRRLQDDLATMTREVQAIHFEKDQALKDKDELKMRVHYYISEVSRAEKLMAAKEKENNDLLERFNMACLKSQEQEQELSEVKGLNGSTRLELLSSDAERRRLLEAVGKQEREIQQHMQAQQAYESRVSSLVRGMSRLEQKLHDMQEENAALLADQAAMREVCVKLDSDKELKARQLSLQSMDLERVTAELEDVRSEVDVMKKQLASERVTVRKLETLLSSIREKEIKAHLSSSERESELKVLRDRLSLADSKETEHNREASQLRNRLSQLQTEIDVLNRQLTTERFERERAVQEMRRQGVSFSPLQSTLNRTASSLSPTHHVSPERSILRTLNCTIDKPGDRCVSFKD